MNTLSYNKGKILYTIFSKNPMAQFNIIMYIPILLSIISYGCKKFNQDRLPDSNQENTVPLFVLLNGLNASASCFNNLKDKLKRAFPDASIIALTSVEKDMTSLCSIKEQANLSFKEFLEKASDLQSSPIILIGHSQGGLRAYKMFDLYKDVLNIKGIVTLATPWEGAPILSADRALFAECSRAPVLGDIQRFSKSLGQPTDWLKQCLMSNLENFKYLSALPGCNDLKQGSLFLDWVKNTLPSETVPILAVGGGQNNFKIFLPMPQKVDHHFKALNKIWTQLIVGKTDLTERHDMVIPLYSQLALNIVPYKSTNFKRLSITDALHDEIFDPKLVPVSPITKSKNILAHPVVFKEIETFAKSILYRCNLKTNRQQDLVTKSA